ncbi:hypothetical protein M153_117000781 [Pseudoloma neurophilia]|uniref:Uncharacterized protein n=1 Tax=Pseudoloma neurophilia TaxID=146866 RepID=A0A0R0M5M6_9MICR|nr:hypothetical protein M153_117000781 [Pseudoloma neurophilia]
MERFILFAEKSIQINDRSFMSRMSFLFSHLIHLLRIKQLKYKN